MKGIGYFLGAVFGAALLFFIISYIFLRPRDISNKEIKQFITDSELKKIDIVPHVGGILSKDDERLGTDIVSKMTYFSNRNMSYIRADTYTFFCKELNKYVSTYVISEGGGMNSEFLQFGDKDKDKTTWPDIYMYYNKKQNTDPSYGRIDKPLPILHFRSSDPKLRSMRQNNKDSDPAYLKIVYEENVKLYLQYFIDKEDFKKLFPDS
ncbi:hypothetical protein [Chryseobacterium sp. Marseille-Q3244]|uniref:hypothetical protein n=1 Tax=Chryseobacterium sp. Marseille-Q3244 TaxID=2758092 RepID=UPI002025139E|nr:hypothetical protein [Chryseobacterium sp. Marseille-Q3244]